MMTTFGPRARILAILGGVALLPSGVRALANGGDETKDEAVAPMVRPLNGPAPGALGEIKVEKEDGGKEQSIEFEADHLLPGHSYFVFLEDAVGSGVLVNVGMMWTHEEGDDDGGDCKSKGGDDDDDDGGWGNGDDDDDNGSGSGDDDDDDDGDGGSSGTGLVEAKLEFETECNGSGLPFGVTDVELLANRIVQIRDEANIVYLGGIVPSLLAPTQTRHAHRTLHPNDHGSGQVRIMKVPKKPRNTFEVRVNGAKGHDHAVVRVEDPKTHVMVVAGTIVLDAKGKGKLVLDTAKGQALPLGKSCNEPLCNRKIDVRDAASGQEILSGKIPKF